MGYRFQLISRIFENIEIQGCPVIVHEVFEHGFSSFDRCGQEEFRLGDISCCPLLIEKRFRESPDNQAGPAVFIEDFYRQR